MLINISNHPYEEWDDRQKEMALIYGDVMDLGFPDVEPDGDEEYIDALTDRYMENVMALSKGIAVTLHVMGEMTFTFAMVSRCRQAGIECIASTSSRSVKKNPDGSKNVSFRFVRFRKYI